jgi:hypothetical protein
MGNAQSIFLAKNLFLHFASDGQKFAIAVSAR